MNRHRVSALFCFLLIGGTVLQAMDKWDPPKIVRLNSKKTCSSVVWLTGAEPEGSRSHQSRPGSPFGVARALG